MLVSGGDWDGSRWLTDHHAVDAGCRCAEYATTTVNVGGEGGAACWRATLRRLGEIGCARLVDYQLSCNTSDAS